MEDLIKSRNTSSQSPVALLICQSHAPTPVLCPFGVSPTTTPPVPSRKSAGALLDSALTLMVVGLHYGEDAWTDWGRRRTPRPTASWPPSWTPRTQVPADADALFPFHPAFCCHSPTPLKFLCRLCRGAKSPIRLRGVPRRPGDGEQPPDPQREPVVGPRHLGLPKPGRPVGDGVRQPRRHALRVAARVVLPQRRAAAALPGAADEHAGFR